MLTCHGEAPAPRCYIGSCQPPTEAARASASDGPQVPLWYSATGGGSASDVLEDAPLLVEGVGPAEPAGVAVHRVLEQALVGLLAVAEHLVEGHLEVDRPAGQLVARAPWSGGAASRRRPCRGGSAGGWGAGRGRRPA